MAAYVSDKFPMLTPILATSLEQLKDYTFETSSDLLFFIGCLVYPKEM